MSEELYGDWNLYRHNLSRHVLNTPETTLRIGAPGPRGEDDDEDTCLAEFHLSGFDKPVRVVMDKDAKTGAWFGADGSFDFRWDRVELYNGNPKDKLVVLIGHATDRSHSKHCDFFVAVRSSTAIQLPAPQNGTYNLEACYKTLLERRTRRKEVETGIRIRLKDGKPKTVELGGDTYTIESFSDEHGLELTGEWSHPSGLKKSLWLWLFAVAEGAETERLLATGYLYEVHMPPGAGPSKPGSEYCGHTIQGGGRKRAVRPR